MTRGRSSGRHAGSSHSVVLETRDAEHDAVVLHIDRRSRGLTHGLQVIEGLHLTGVEFRSLSVFHQSFPDLSGLAGLQHPPSSSFRM